VRWLWAAKRGGSRKGAPNRATTDLRAAIALLAQKNVSRLQQWLDTIAEKNPEKAYELFLRTCEYHIPKLGRQEITRPGGGPLLIYREVYQRDRDTGDFRPSDQPAVDETPMAETAAKRDFEEL